MLDLEHDSLAHTVSTTDFCDLSRYMVEDMLRSVAGTRFLVCIDTKSDFENLPREVAVA